MFLYSLYTLTQDVSCKEFFVKAILKLMGVSVSKLEALQKLLASDRFHGVYVQAPWSSISNNEPEQKRVNWAQVVRSTSKDGDDYLVDLELVLSYSINHDVVTVKDPVLDEDREEMIRGDYKVIPPFSLVQEIWTVLGVYSESEQPKRIKVG